MTNDEMAAEFNAAAGKQQLRELIAHLQEVRAKEPAFATAACSDAVLALETLLKTPPMLMQRALRRHAARSLRLSSTALRITRSTLSTKVLKRDLGQSHK